MAVKKMKNQKIWQEYLSWKERKSLEDYKPYLLVINGKTIINVMKIEREVTEFLFFNKEHRIYEDLKKTEKEINIQGILPERDNRFNYLKLSMEEFPCRPEVDFLKNERDRLYDENRKLKEALNHILNRNHDEK